MAIRYTVQAAVVDLATDTPQATDVFLVDTNVWYWLTYSRASQSVRPPLAYQTTRYPGYLNAALGVGAQLVYSGLSLAELTHVIEQVERDIYAATAGPISTKEYRHNLPQERRQVCAEIQAAWGVVTSLAAPLPLLVDAQTATAALTRLPTTLVDGYDLLLLESMQRQGVVQVLTDDGDFATILGLQVFTANRTVLQTARRQGRLLTR